LQPTLFRGPELKKVYALLALLLAVSLILAFPNTYAQTTRIYELLQPIHAVAGSHNPLNLKAIVYYNDTSPGSTLVVGILDMDSASHGIVPAIVTSSPDSCMNQGQLAALCAIGVKTASGAESLEFKIGGILGGKSEPGTWDLNMTSALFDSANKLIPKSVSTVLFGISLMPVALKVNVPAAVVVTVDGVPQPPGPAVVGVALGEHNITVPSLVQVDPGTRLALAHWPDGSTNANRTLSVTGDMSFDVTYSTQYLLSLVDPQASASGAGWYNEGQEATFSVPSREPMGSLLGALGGKLNFKGWYENDQLLTTLTSGTVLMNQPRTITAVFQPDYTEPGVVLVGIIIAVVLAYLLVRRRTTKTRERRPRRGRRRVKRKS
jgi:hypothetical protein